MSDKTKVQADGGGTQKGAPDGVSQSRVSGRGDKGESGGGPYPNPHRGKDGDGSFGGFMGHGGQTDNSYPTPEHDPVRKTEHRDDDGAE